MTDPRRPAPAASGAVYDADYYAHYDDRQQPGGGAYRRGEPWLSLFAGFADRIVRDMAPATALDAGCAHGFLVEALRDRGVDASGFDLSEYAISQVREDVRPHVRVGSLLEPIPGRYDLVICLEVLEHLDERDADVAVGHIAAVTDDVLFSSTPDDWREETHVNVRPLEYWTELFARHGLVRDVGFDTSFISWWAARYRRRRDPWERVVAAYERELGRLRTEAHHRNQVVAEQMEQLRERRGAEPGSPPPGGAGGAPASGGAARLEADLSETQSRLVELVRRNQELRRELDLIRASRSWRVARALRGVARAVAPAGSRRARAAARAVRPGRRALHRRAPAPAPRGPDSARRAAEYGEWLARHRPGPADLRRMRADSRAWRVRPTVSVIVPVFDPEPSWLEAAIRSVTEQTYERWELCIADDASTKPGVRELLERLPRHDPRIRVTFREANGGISAASNSALALATGEHITLLDHDDVMEPHALHRLVERLQEDPAPDLVYSDEDKLSPDGRRCDPFFKPDWSPELLLSFNYITHMALIRRSLVERVGGFRSETDGAQDYDLFLRCTEQAARIAHVPEVLYSWRQVPGSAALSGEGKPWAYPAGRRAVREAVARRGIDADVEDGSTLGVYDVHRRISHHPPVAVLVPTRDRADLLSRCLDSVAALTTYPRYAVTVLDNDSRTEEARRLFRDRHLSVVAVPGPFNFSRIVNRGVAAVDAEYVVLLNNDTVVRTPGWIEALLEQAVAGGVAAVGARLLFPDGRPQHQGVTIDDGPGGIPTNFGEPAEIDMPMCWTVPREVSAVTGACMMVSTAVWHEVGGFDESLGVALNDVDFCLRARERGYRVIYTPRAELIHEESGSRGPLHPSDDERRFRERWLGTRGHRDPYTTPNLGWVGGRLQLV